MRRRYHMHLPGVIYAGVTVFLIVGAINSQNNLLFWAAGLALGGILVSGIISGAALMGVRVERSRIEPGTVGQPLVIEYVVRNRNRFVPAFGLTIEELDRPIRGGGGGAGGGGGVEGGGASVL